MTEQAPATSTAEKIIKAYEDGYSDVEICRILKLTQKRFDALYDEHMSFREMVDVGRVMAKAWWWSKGRENIDNTKFNTTLWAFNMKNRYGWADKTEAVNTNNNYEDMDLDALSGQMRKMLPHILADIQPDVALSKVVALDSVRSK